jgi:hypothetical protein
LAVGCSTSYSGERDSGIIREFIAGTSGGRYGDIIDDQHGLGP